ncbi:MAG: alpha/beta fold hydrolase [Desulfobulbaceae bacterium]|nr:alpha/beta fold hydrolase [Desulfobulbaceae bacterium]MBS4001336.1 alpha/beta fold hydrolase [Desulfobulbaceae bacterium]
MKTIFTLIMLLLATTLANGQNIYTTSFGSSLDKPIIFLHGGPGYNCVNFESTTAQQLADKGYYVIVYDRRGEGRSKDPNAKFTFKETFEDLNSIYQQNNLTKATLIGHSFGGIVATLFAEANPNKVQSIILVGAPVSLQSTFKNILTKSKSIYQAKNDSVNLKYVTMLENMNTSSIEYSSYCFGHAMQNGFYTTKNPSDEAKNIYAKFRTDTSLAKYASQMSYEAPQGFWKNEKYTTIDVTENLQDLINQKVKIYGLYGKEDGLFSAQQIDDLEKLIGIDNIKYFDNCSHNVFMDQQSQFIDNIIAWTKE